MVKAENGKPSSGVFSYSSVLGILLFMSGNIYPDAALAVSCCCRYMFSPKRYQKLALKILARYLKQTKDHDLVLDPNSDVCKVESFLGYMDMRSLIILLVLRAVPNLSSLLRNFLFAGFQSYRWNSFYNLEA